MTVRIGITGPIGCGKSTVAGWLRELGAVTVDADEVARAVVEPGQPTLEAVIAAFGEGLRAADGGLDRAALGRIVFADPAALRRLEAIVHPAVRPRVERAIADAEAAGATAVVVEAIKLVEGGLAALCDEVWLVTCAPAVQRARLVGRGMDRADAEARIRAQGNLTGRLSSVATRVIDTAGPPDRARVMVVAAFEAATSRPGCAGFVAGEGPGRSAR